MRLASANRQFESTLENKARAFSIATSAKAFEILSNSLYKHKELAVLRELIANAYDAHVKAKTTHIPFQVHLPTMLEPFFKIKDFGTGLSEDAIYELYTTYFSSDKTMSNELIGGLGLGSKSPFAYTDQFSVESRHNRILTRFHIYIGGDGVPMVSKLHETHTDEANGLTVEVPVATKDVSSFAAAAIQILPHLPTPYELNAKPEDLSHEKLQAPEYYAELQIDPVTTIRVQKHDRKSYWHGVKESVVIQGIIAYPLDTHSFNDHGNSVRQMLNLGLSITVPIGTFDIAASREGLSYTPQTKAAISALLIRAVIPLAQKVKSEIDSAPDLLEARVRADNSAYGIRDLLDNYRSHSEYKRLNATDKAEFDLMYEWYVTKPTWNGTDLNRIEIPKGLVIKKVRQTRRSVTTTDYITELRLSSTDATERPKIYWRDKSAPFKTFFEQDKVNRLPAWLLIGEEALAKEFVEKIGLTWDTAALRLPDVKRASRVAGTGGRVAYGAHKYTTIGHGNITAPVALATGHQLVISRCISDANHIKEILQICQDIGVIENGDKSFLFMVVPSAHNKVRDTLIKDGAIHDIKSLIKKFPINTNVLATLTAHRDGIQLPNEHDWDLNGAANRNSTFNNALEAAGLDALALHVRRSQYFTLLMRHAYPITNYFKDTDLITKKEQAAATKQLKAIIACYIKEGERLRKQHPLFNKPHETFSGIAYCCSEHIIEIIMHYFQTTTPKAQP